MLKNPARTASKPACGLMERHQNTVSIDETCNLKSSTVRKASARTNCISSRGKDGQPSLSQSLLHMHPTVLREIGSRPSIGHKVLQTWGEPQPVRATPLLKPDEMENTPSVKQPTRSAHSALKSPLNMRYNAQAKHLIQGVTLGQRQKGLEQELD